jgi:hypothetical protein
MNDENPIAMKSVLAAKLEGYVRVAVCFLLAVRKTQ